MIKSGIAIITSIIIVLFFLSMGQTGAQTSEEPIKLRFMENLGRGLVAINQGNGRVYVGGRLLGTDPNEISFNLYRSAGGALPVKLNDQPITQNTNFIDTGVDLNQPNSYFVRPVLDGQESGRVAGGCVPFLLQENAP